MGSFQVATRDANKGRDYTGKKILKGADKWQNISGLLAPVLENKWVTYQKIQKYKKAVLA